MLLAQGEITFFSGDKINKKYPLRPVFKLGDGLYSGQIISDIEMFHRNNAYTVLIAFFLVIDEAYSDLKPIIKEDMIAPIQEGSRVIGTSRLWDFDYVGENREYIDEVKHRVLLDYIAKGKKQGEAARKRLRKLSIPTVIK